MTKSIALIAGLFFLSVLPCNLGHAQDSTSPQTYAVQHKSTQKPDFRPVVFQNPHFTPQYHLLPQPVSLSTLNPVIRNPHLNPQQQPATMTTAFDIQRQNPGLVPEINVDDRFPPSVILLDVPTDFYQSK